MDEDDELMLLDPAPPSGRKPNGTGRRDDEDPDPDEPWNRGQGCVVQLLLLLLPLLLLSQCARGG